MDKSLQPRVILARLLPPGSLPYLLHLRPRAWPIVAAHMSVGFLLANGLGLSSGGLRQWLLAAIAWAVLGNGGTLALNSVFDRDGGDIGYLDDPPPVPRGLLSFSIAVLLAGWLVAALVGRTFFVAYTICFALSVLYSVPPFRAKARAGFDVLINSVGFGGLTVFAGWAALAKPLTAPILAVSGGFFFLFAGFYPLTQIYQMDEDRSRGDSTLALALGRPKALLFATSSILMAFGLFIGQAAVGYLTLRSSGLLVSMALWLALLVPWMRHATSLSQAREQRGFYQALWIWAITDIAVVIAMCPTA